MGWIRIMFVFLRSLLRSQAVLAAENLALRQQLAVLSEQKRRPRLRKRDRIFWVWLSKFWTRWRSVLLIVQPCCPPRHSALSCASSRHSDCMRGRAEEDSFAVEVGAPFRPVFEQARLCTRGFMTLWPDTPLESSEVTSNTRPAFRTRPWSSAG